MTYRNTALDKNVDLHYSPDEDEWYLQDYGRNRVSVGYDSRSEALDAYKRCEIDWL